MMSTADTQEIYRNIRISSFCLTVRSTPKASAACVTNLETSRGEAPNFAKSLRQKKVIMELTDYFVHIGDKNINRTPCSQEKKAYNHLYLKAPINKRKRPDCVVFRILRQKSLIPSSPWVQNILFNNKISIQEALATNKYYCNKLQLNNVGWSQLN